jgi:hypothetical protein
MSETEKEFGVSLELKPLVPIFFIAVLSIVVAVITFGSFQSSANVVVQDLSFSGAIAGFIGTFLVLFSVYSNIYDKASQNKLGEYREIIDRLRLKIIKGAPCPDGFEIEMDEKHKFVFAHPSTWKPQQGMLYYFSEDVPEREKGIRKTKGRFYIYYMDNNTLFDTYNIDKKTDLKKLHYKKIYEMLSEKTLEHRNNKMVKSYPSYKLIDSTNECIKIDDIPSLKINQTFSVLAKELIDQGEEEACYPDKTKTIVLKSTRILTYNKRLEGLFEFSSVDEVEDYMVTSEIFNQVATSIRFI